MRLGIFGGSFDPVHEGHLGLARAAREALMLDEVLFVPAFSPPHKPGQRLAAVAHRLAMLDLALADDPACAVSRLEADSGHPVYTIDTVRALRAQYGPEAALVLLLGWDAWRDLPDWKEATALRALVHVAVAPRPDNAGAAPPLDERAHLIPAAPRAVASRDIRARVARGESLSGLVPPAVAAYIAAHGLYRDV